jgi:putative ABC transport system permease protein
MAADRVVTWATENFNQASGGVPFWITPGLRLSTIVYAGGLAVITAVMLSVLPALRVTQVRLQSHLANRSAGGATLRFGRVWTGAMIAQVALTAIGIPVAMETANQATLKLNIRAAFPSREYLAARIDLDRPFEDGATSEFAARRARTLAELQRRIAQEPGVVAVTFADRAPGSGATERFGEVESSPGAEPVYDGGFRISAVAPGFFEAFDRRIVAGRAFHGGDWSPPARTVIVNEAFARAYSREAGNGSPIGARLRYPDRSAASASATGPWFEIVGVVRDFGLDPDDSGDELPFVFHATSVGTMAPLVMSVRVRGNPAPLAARLPVIAADADASLLVRDAQPLGEWIRQRDDGLTMQAGALAAVTSLVLFLSALGIFSLVSVGVSRRTREIGLRAALGAHPRHLLAGILSGAAVLMASGITVGGALLLWAVALGQGPSGRPANDVALFAGYLGLTSAVMLAACLLACIGPARRALRITPTEALREA